MTVAVRKAWNCFDWRNSKVKIVGRGWRAHTHSACSLVPLRGEPGLGGTKHYFGVVRVGLCCGVFARVLGDQH